MTSQEKETKRLERIKRKERKNNEKIKQKKEEERERRKRQRIKLKIEDIQRKGMPSDLNLDELQDDVLMFRDSDRDSVVSYFYKNGAVKETLGLDTPTRILNNSNEFLPIQFNEDIKKAIKEIESPG